ncbi:MAG: GNAT family N-acetyltransferase, partial [Oscillospiraceae bacterium]|nr:GNAT family N-acetyltransferase [Oscillospiraceae bacterium]
MEIRYINENDDLYAISDIYEQSWKYAYKGMIPQSYLDSIPRGRWVNGIGKAGNTDLVMEENGRL